MLRSHLLLPFPLHRLPSRCRLSGFPDLTSHALIFFQAISALIPVNILPVILFVLCLVARLCPALCDAMDCSLPGSSVHGILQARILEWVAMPSSRGSSCLVIELESLMSPALAGSLPLVPPEKPLLRLQCEDIRTVM